MFFPRHQAVLLCRIKRPRNSAGQKSGAYTHELHGYPGAGVSNTGTTFLQFHKSGKLGAFVPQHQAWPVGDTKC
jgi:hypothetical protein